MKHIAIIGSSGGNLYRQGGSDPNKLLGEIIHQITSVDMDISFINFIGASRSMDGINDSAPAKLWTLENGEIVCGSEKSLKEVNVDAVETDKILARKIENGEIDGIIMMSCDPKVINNASLLAAATKKIPCVGTGGTSVAESQKLGVNVISASGTTGTTNRTRAVAFTASLADHFKMKYTPLIGSSTVKSQQEGSVWKRINFRGIMMASLPGFIAMALVLAISKIPQLSSLEDVFNTLIGVIPIIISAIAAKQVSGLDEVGIVAGIIAGVLSKDGGLIGGLVSGVFAGVLAYYIIMFCLQKKMPATTANIFAGGLGGLVSGLVGLYALSPLCLWLGNGINTLISSTLAYSPILAGLLAGLLIWPAILGGVYHAAILPIVMLEMEATGYSFLGAIDLTGLVMVSAGITLANVLVPKTKADRTAALPGFAINVLFGTFVEASYPYMFSSKLVFATAIIASGISGTLVGMLGVKGTAYVPAMMAPFLANEGHIISMALCMIVAMAVAFVGVMFANKLEKGKGE